MCKRIFLIFGAAAAVFLAGGCKAFRAMFDEDPRARRSAPPAPAPVRTAPGSGAAKASSPERTFWGTPRKKPAPFVGEGLSEFERSEIRRMRSDELPDRTEQIEKDRQKRKDWVFGR